MTAVLVPAPNSTVWMPTPNANSDGCEIERTQPSTPPVSGACAVFATVIDVRCWTPNCWRRSTIRHSVAKTQPVARMQRPDSDAVKQGLGYLVWAAFSSSQVTAIHWLD